MKLTYRGVTYDYVPTPVGFGKTSMTGKYRGVPVIYPTLTADVPQPDVELTYRGVTYRTGQPSRARELVALPKAGAEATGTSSTSLPSVSLEEQLRQLMMNHHRQIVNREHSMLVRTDEAVGLPIDAALHFRNHIQGYNLANTMS